MTETILESAKKDKQTERPVYESPKVTVMTEDEVLQAFQINQAGVTWWVM